MFTNKLELDYNSNFYLLYMQNLFIYQLNFKILYKYMYSHITIFFLIIILIIIYYNKYFTIIETYECRLPKFNPNAWNKKNNKIQEFNNCYSYAMHDLKLDQKKKQQPGSLCKTMKPLKKKFYSCQGLMKRVQCDYPDTILLNNDSESCPCDYYKVALFLDKTGKKRDYHFYKQNKEGFWSHKPGKTKVTNLDADGKIIKNPINSNRKYKKYNYNEKCGILCKKYIVNKHIEKYNN